MAAVNTENIVKLTPDVIRTLLDSRRPSPPQPHERCQRRELRWPFSGTVEVWLPETCYGERHILATLHNLSPHGLALRAERPIPKDTLIKLAVHEPLLTCYGDAVVRHCTQAHVGYLVGVEFIFPTEDAPASAGA